MNIRYAWFLVFFSVGTIVYGMEEDYNVEKFKKELEEAHESCNVETITRITNELAQRCPSLNSEQKNALVKILAHELCLLEQGGASFCDLFGTNCSNQCDKVTSLFSSGASDNESDDDTSSLWHPSSSRDDDDEDARKSKADAAVFVGVLVLAGTALCCLANGCIAFGNAVEDYNRQRRYFTQAPEAISAILVSTIQELQDQDDTTFGQHTIEEIRIQARNSRLLATSLDLAHVSF